MNTKYYVIILMAVLSGATLAKDYSNKTSDSINAYISGALDVILAKDSSSRTLDFILSKDRSIRADTLYIIPVEEKCADSLNLYSYSTDSLELASISKRINLWSLIFDNIPESCEAIFITEKLYKTLKVIKNNANILFTDKIYSCENNGNEKKSDIALAKNCRINITTGIWPFDTLKINNSKYYLDCMMYD